MIISASRRTDIPAFYSEWLMNRIREGFVLVRNPMNYNSVSRVSLREDVVDCIVFWSKNPQPLMPHLPEIRERYEGHFYFQFTLNAYGADIEPHLPPLEQRLETFCRVAELYGRDRVVWRYDPILLSDRYTVEWHVEMFQKLFEALKGQTDTCVLSFLDLYDKIRLRCREAGISAPDRNEMLSLADQLSDVVQSSGVTLRSCAEDIDLSMFDIEPNSCIDKVRIERILGTSIHAKPDGQREHCGCIECIDIGQYNTCRNGCRYCYANFSEAQVSRNAAGHSPTSPLLVGELNPSDRITERKMKSLANPQTCLF